MQAKCALWKKLSVCCLDFGLWRVQFEFYCIFMRRRVKIYLFGFAILIAVVLVYCHSLTYVHRAPEDHYKLWMGVLKPFVGQVYYVGSDGDFSYFRAGKLLTERYKVRTSELKLPRTFPFGKGEPYIVTLEMVPEN